MTDEDKILNSSKTIAIVGLSSNTDRPSNIVGKYLQEHGYKIIPVNPTQTEILGELSYPSLSSVPDRIDVVDIFRRSEEVAPIVDESIKMGIKFIWMQEGVIDEEAAEKARNAGMTVVMNRCIKKEHLKLSNKNK